LVKEGQYAGTTMSFWTSQYPADALTERMTILDSGNVGIGTSSPASLLHVAGTVQVGVDGTGHDVKFFGDTAGSFMLWDESADALLLTDSTPIQIGDTQDLTLYHDGTNSYITNKTGALKIATETSGIAVSIGHTTSETTVNDNLTVTGTATFGGNINATGASGDHKINPSSGQARFTIESPSANGNNVYLALKSSDTEWRWTTNRGDQISGNQGDLFLREDTASVNALIFETNTGNATFAGNIQANGTLTVGVNADIAGTVTMPNLPTSDPLVAGELWNSGGDLKVSAGS